MLFLKSLVCFSCEFEFFCFNCYCTIFFNDLASILYTSISGNFEIFELELGISPKPFGPEFGQKRSTGLNSVPPEKV